MRPILAWILGIDNRQGSMNQQIFTAHDNSVNPRAVQYGLSLASDNDFDHWLIEHPDVALGITLKEDLSCLARSSMLDDYFNALLSTANDYDYSDFSEKLASAFKILGPETKRRNDRDSQLQLHSFIIYLSTHHSNDVKRIKSIFSEHLILPSGFEAYYHDCLFNMVNNHSFDLSDTSNQNKIIRANRIQGFDFDFIVKNEWFHVLANPTCPTKIIDDAITYILNDGKNHNVFHVARNPTLSNDYIDILSDISERSLDSASYLNALNQNPAYYKRYVENNHIDFSKLKDLPDLTDSDHQFNLLMQYINQGNEIDSLIRSFTTPGLLRYPLENKLTGKLSREQRMHLLEVISDKVPQIAVASIFNSVDLFHFIDNKNYFSNRFQELASAHITYSLSRNSDNNFNKLQLFMHALSSGAINPDQTNPFLFLQGSDNKAVSPVEYVFSELNQKLVNEISAKILEVKAARAPIQNLKVSSKIKML